MVNMLGTGGLVRQLRLQGYKVSAAYIDRLVSDGIVDPAAVVSGHRIWGPEALVEIGEILRQRGRKRDVEEKQFEEAPEPPTRSTTEGDAEPRESDQAAEARQS